MSSYLFTDKLLVQEEELMAQLKQMISQSEVPFSDFSQHIMHDFVQGISNIFLSKVFVEGFYTRELERVLEQRFGRSVIATPSGTAALTAALECFLSPKKNEVIVPSLTFAATIQAIIHAGGIPRFVDVSPSDWTIDTDAVTMMLSKRTGAIVPVHLFGNPCDVSNLNIIGKDARVAVVYDSCQAFGSSTVTGPIGVFGDAEAFSLDATKVLSTVLGGFVTFRDDASVEKARLVKNFGNDIDRRTLVRGFNGRMSEFHALLGLNSFSAVDTRIKKMMSIAAEYRHTLNDIDGVLLQEQRYGTQCPQNFGIFLKKG